MKTHKEWVWRIFISYPVCVLHKLIIESQDSDVLSSSFGENTTVVKGAFWIGSLWKEHIKEF